MTLQEIEDALDDLREIRNMTPQDRVAYLQLCRYDAHEFNVEDVEQLQELVDDYL